MSDEQKQEEIDAAAERSLRGPGLCISREEEILAKAYTEEKAKRGDAVILVAEGMSVVKMLSAKLEKAEASRTELLKDSYEYEKRGQQLLAQRNHEQDRAIKAEARAGELEKELAKIRGENNALHKYWMPTAKREERLRLFANKETDKFRNELYLTSAQRDEAETALERSRLELARVREAVSEFRDFVIKECRTGDKKYGIFCLLTKNLQEALSHSDSKAWLAGEIEKRVGPLKEACYRLARNFGDKEPRLVCRECEAWKTECEKGAPYGHSPKCSIGKVLSSADAKGEAK